MSFNIQIDYRFARKGAFDKAFKQAIEEAANLWEAFLDDEFPDISAGSKITTQNPQTGKEVVVTLDKKIDDLLIFVGRQPIEGNVGANAAAWYGRTDKKLMERFNGDDFQPWVGRIIFNTEFPDFLDVIGTTVHEIGHVIGIGSAPIYQKLVKGDKFDGPTARAVYGGRPIPVIPGGHIGTGSVNGQFPAVGGGGLPSVIDLAILKDIGYDVPVLEQKRLPKFLNYTLNGTNFKDSLKGFAGKDYITGRNKNDFLQGGKGKDILNGEAGNDTCFGQEGNDIIYGGSGDDLITGNQGKDVIVGGSGDDSLFGTDAASSNDKAKDIFFFAPKSGNDVIDNFVVADDKIQVSQKYGFSSRTDVKEALDKKGSFIVIGKGGEQRMFKSELTLETNNIITIESNEPLKVSSFLIENL